MPQDNGWKLWDRLRARFAPAPARLPEDHASCVVHVSDKLGDVTITGRRAGDPYIFGWLQLGQVFEPHILAALEQLSEPGALLLDVGANIGWFSVIGSRLVGPSGRVVAFEPDPLNHAFLRHNVLGNGCANVEVVAAAIGAGRGAALLYRSAENAGDHRLSRNSDRSDAVSVPVRPLAPYLRRRRQPVCLVKIDTQGYESAVLRGLAPRLGDRGVVRLIMEYWPHGLHDCGSSPAELASLLGGFDQFWLLTPAGAVTPIAADDLISLAQDDYTPASERHADIVALQAKDVKAVQAMRRLQTG